MAHAQKPDFVFRRNGRVHLNRQGVSVQSTTGSRVMCTSSSNGSNAGYTMFRGSAKSTGYPLHLPASPSLPFPCVTVCHHISTGLYYSLRLFKNCSESRQYIYFRALLTHCGRVTQICVFNTVKLGTSASSP